MMRSLLVAVVVLLAIQGVVGQDIYEKLSMKPPPKNPRQNAGMLFAGMGLNILGVAGMAGTVYYYAEFYGEEEENLLPAGVFTASLGLAVAGTAMVIKSIGNMAKSRPDRKKLKNTQPFPPDLSVTIEPTRYGVGIVCRF